MEPFDCRSLDAQLEALLDGTLDDAARRAAEAHARACPRCADLVGAARRDLTAPPGLLDAVLAATSGQACAQARERLGDLVDGRLDALDAETLGSHLGACPPCEALRRIVAATSADLPALAELDPGEGFVEAVVSRSGPRLRHVRPWAEPWLERWQRLWRRPRFALEAAYALTLVAVLLFGVPDARVVAASRRAADLAPTQLPYRVERSVGRFGTRVAAGAQDAWESARNRVADDARPAIAEIESSTATALADVRARLGTLWARVASAVTDDDDDERSDRHDGRRNGDEP